MLTTLPNGFEFFVFFLCIVLIVSLLKAPEWAENLAHKQASKKSPKDRSAKAS